MKIKLIGLGKNKHNVGGKMKKPDMERSKSAPPGFGGTQMAPLVEISPDLIDFLMKMEEKQQETASEQSFLQLPLKTQPQIREKKEKKEENNNIIVIDL